jgi:hypothetical protein
VLQTSPHLAKGHLVLDTPKRVIISSEHYARPNYTIRPRLTASGIISGGSLFWSLILLALKAIAGVRLALPRPLRPLDRCGRGSAGLTPAVVLRALSLRPPWVVRARGSRERDGFWLQKRRQAYYGKFPALWH